MENNKNTNENGPYKHFERPTTTRRANDKKVKKHAEIAKDQKGHPQLWAGIIIIAIILIALIPIVESKLNGSNKNLAQKEVSTSQSSTSSHKKSKKKKSVTKAKKKFLANKDGYYTLRAGDTLTEIAKANDTTVAEIMRLNGLSGENDVEVGQTLKIKEVNNTMSASTSSTVNDDYSSKSEATSVSENSTSAATSEQTSENNSSESDNSSTEQSSSNNSNTAETTQNDQ